MRAFRLLLMLMLMVPTTVMADGFTDLKEARKLADKTMTLFQQEKIVDAYNTLKPFWPLSPVEIDGLANQTNTQWPLIKQRFGTSISVEFIKEKKGGKSLAEFVYLQKFQNHALRWTFTFYKPRDRWLINAVSFDDNISLVLNE